MRSYTETMLAAACDAIADANADADAAGRQSRQSPSARQESSAPVAAPPAAAGGVAADAGGVVAFGAADADAGAAGPDTFGERRGRAHFHGRYAAAVGRRSARLRAARRGANAQDIAGGDGVGDGGGDGGGGGDESGDGDGGDDGDGCRAGGAKHGAEDSVARGGRCVSFSSVLGGGWGAGAASEADTRRHRVGNPGGSGEPGRRGAARAAPAARSPGTAAGARRGHARDAGSGRTLNTLSAAFAEDTLPSDDETLPVRPAAAARLAGLQRVLEDQEQKRRARLERIDRAERMEFDAALAASSAAGASDAAARMVGELDMPEGGVSDENDPMVDDTSAADREHHDVGNAAEVEDVLNGRAAALRVSLAARRAGSGRSRGRGGRGGATRPPASVGAAVEADGAAGRGRGRSWSHSENIAVCKGWLTVTRDPILGTDQTSSAFYAAVFKACRRLFFLPTGWPPQSGAAVVRFLRYTLFKNVQLVASVYVRVCRRNVTGNMTEEDLIRATTAELDSGDAYEALQADPDHDLDEPDPQARARARGFRATDWIPSWRLLRTSDKFSGAAAAAASAPPPRGRGPSSPLARGRERRDAGAAAAAMEDGEGEDDDDDGHNLPRPWRPPEWEPIPIGAKRAKATRSVEISMQRDCASMARTLSSLAEAANDQVDQSFFFSRWMRC